MVRKRKIENIVTYHIDLYLDVAWTSSNDMSWTPSYFRKWIPSCI